MAEQQVDAKVDKQREAKIAAHIVKKLIETGERDRLKEWTRAKLVEAGWKEQLKRDCIEYIKKKGKDNVTAEELMEVFQPLARDSIPVNVRAELVQRMRLFLSK